MVLGMVVEALKGAAEEVRAGSTICDKARRTFRLTRTILGELVGIFSSVPYAIHATNLWRNPEKHQRRWRFQLLRDLRYGPAPRNLLDVYTPSTSENDTSSLPVVLFVHGGVWASGDKSLYSPVGAILAHHGVIALMVQYTLYPQVLARQQVKEVSQALTWAMDNISHYGGNPKRIHVMGHSSGGHLCGMLFWERARQNLEFRNLDELPDNRLPCYFLGLSGVFNIGEHYKFEQGRGVALISCMKGAMNGPKGFPSMSPELLFGSLLTLKGSQKLETAEIEAGLDLSNLDSVNMDWHSWASKQPPCAFFTSDCDIVVPPLTSLNFHQVLQGLGCKSTVTQSRNLEHGDFACWLKGIQGKENPAAKSLIRDILDIVKDESKVNTAF